MYPPDYHSGFPHLEKEDHLPPNPYLGQSQLGWITQIISPLLHRSFYCSISTGTSAQPKACGVSCALHRPGLSFLNPFQLLHFIHPAHWRWKTLHSAGKRKLSYENGMGCYRRLRCRVRKCVSSYFLYRAFLTQILQHVTVLLFSMSTTIPNKTSQTFQTTQLSWISLPDVLMFQDAVSFTKRCSHSEMASSTVKTQWEREKVKRSLSLAWCNKGNILCCTWFSSTPIAWQKLGELSPGDTERKRMHWAVLVCKDC